MSRLLRNILFTSLCAVGLAACQPSPGSTRLVGQLESDRVELTAEVAEPIRARLVAEGHMVTSGTPLIEQDTVRINDAIAGAKAAVAQSRARQDELIRGPRREQIVAAQASTAGAEQDLEFRRAQFERAEQLFDRKLGSPDVRDQAKAALDAAESNLEVQRARLAELLSGTTIEELRQAEQNVLQLEAQLSALTVDLERRTISAPVDGLVDSVLFEPGERPVPGQPVVVMLTGAQPYARIYIPEELRVRVRAGTPARVFVDGIDAPFQGRVRWIASDAAFTPYFALTERDRGRLTYFAKVDILDGAERLPDGVPVEVELEIGPAGSR
jgi:HlyD family secretion protein